MARINIEEEAWSRIYRLAELMDVSVREAAGTVSCLWHTSQSLVKAIGSQDEIIEWASLLKISDSEVEKWILSLKKCRFISSLNDTQFEIHGNKIQLENMISKSNKAAKGGKALQKKLKELGKLQASAKQASSRLGAGSRGLNALQVSADQCNANQCNANQSISLLKNSSNFISEPKLLTVVKESSNPETQPVREAFVSSYFQRYGVDPVINKKFNSTIKSLVERLGQKDAIEVAKFYLQHHDKFYIGSTHSVGLLLRDCESLRTQWMRGQAITSGMVNQFEKSQVLENTLEQLRKNGI